MSKNCLNKFQAVCTRFHPKFSTPHTYKNMKYVAQTSSNSYLRGNNVCHWLPAVVVFLLACLCCGLETSPLLLSIYRETDGTRRDH